MLLIIFLATITSIYCTCSISYPSYGSLTYNLLPFVNDYNIYSNTYNYIFNICNNVNYIPSINRTVHVPNLPTDCGSNAPSYQLNNDNCYILGNLSTSTYSLYDNFNPAKGVVLTYLNGDVCTYTDPQTKKLAKKPRSFGINFICSDFATIAPSNDVIEDEFSTCEYSATFNSAYACPTQCPIVDNKICSTNGICGYDVDTKNARCFCDTGYEGDACSVLTSSNSNTSNNNSNPTLVLEVFVFILLAVVLVLGYFVYTKIQTIKPEASDYTNLESITIPSTGPIIN